MRALDAYGPGPLNASQLKVEHWIHDAVSVPVIGYLDFGFDGIDIDLKTTKAMPSAARPDHVRQVSLYRVARNRRGALLYVTPKKFAQYEVDDAAMNSALAGLRADALSLSRFLASHADAESAVRSLPMDTEHYAYPTGITLPAYLKRNHLKLKTETGERKWKFRNRAKAGEILNWPRPGRILRSAIG
jgi:hypothetical protein